MALRLSWNARQRQTARTASHLPAGGGVTKPGDRVGRGVIDLKIAKIRF